MKSIENLAHMKILRGDPGANMVNTLSVNDEHDTDSEGASDE